MEKLEEARKELKELKAKVEKADDIKARILLEKMEADDAKTNAQQEMMALAKKQESCQKDFKQQLDMVQDEIKKLSKCKQDILEKLKRSKAELEAQQAETSKLKQRFKICAQIPKTDVKFLARVPEGEEEDRDDSGQSIREVFTISQRGAVLLRGGQALITFEEEKVAHQILRLANCRVSCEKATLDVKPKGISLDTAVKFEVKLDVSRKELKVFDIPPAMSEDRVKDRLEISFSKPSRGGGEVESVDYDVNTRTGTIVFLKPGVAGKLAMKGMYKINLKSEVKVEVGPAYEYKLEKFQTSCCSSKRTILLEGIEDVEDEEDLQDHLEIHFQKPNNSGGEIESIKYISKGKTLQAFFCEDTMEIAN
ncbi:N-myc-interactor [Cyprinodon tularosa]|uniref:N-myc-interactor n=1 Tax=Cyprinodon tularosa TaxID=77115 RepID=UPI0018E24C3D|nr:N-myc-interactor [Cyprinodon tularosa]XP_038150059.1 N-myc-interactor [Cyprinodon tularosa]